MDLTIFILFFIAYTTFATSVPVPSNLTESEETPPDNVASLLEPAKAKCVIERGDPSNSSQSNDLEILCNYIGVDGLSLDKVLRQEPLHDLGQQGKSYQFDQIANRVSAINVYAKGTIQIPKGSLSNSASLRDLNIRNGFGNSAFGNLSISPDALKDLPQLHRLTISNLVVDDGTIQALASIKNKLNSLVLDDVKPEKDVISSVPGFTNLTFVSLRRMCYDGPIPDATFKNSAASLRHVNIEKCHSDSLKAGLFHGLEHLIDLWYVQSNLSQIEPGAFDGLPNLEEVYLYHNNLKSLPDGLFKENTNLTTVVLSENQVENISSANFSSFKNFKKLELESPQAMPF